MVTERQYKNALAVIEKYKEQQKVLKQENIKANNISLSTELWDLHDKELISPKLISKLYEHHKRTVYVQDVYKPCTLEYFTDINQYVFSKWYGVGKKTVEEFVSLMALAGHVVPID